VRRPGSAHHYPSDMSSDAALTPPRLPRPAQRSRTLRIAGIVAAALLLGGWLVWYVVAPDDLATSEKTASASGVAGTPVYVGMFTAPAGFDRSLHLSGVKVHTEASAEVDVTPLLCVGATVGVTTAPERFCEEVVNPEGRTLGAGDSIIVEVTADGAAEAHVERIDLAFREGLRWSTQPAGISGADVTIAGR
jgi:hypothetical protein